MSKLQLNNVKIDLPQGFDKDFDEVDLVEWLEWELGARSDIRLNNPLHDIELSDCNVSVGEAKIDGKNFKF